jgi:hypothetical protein
MDVSDRNAPGPGGAVAVASSGGLDELMNVVRQTRHLVRYIDNSRDAVILVRRASTAEHLVRGAIKGFQLLEEEQFKLRHEAAEAHARTQRRAGELLAQVTKSRGGRPVSAGSPAKAASGGAPTLRDLGVDAYESHRWQRIAGLPGDVFERHLSRCREQRVELTTGSLLRLARERGDEAEDADADAGGEPPSGRAALRREYEQLRRQALNLIWLDPSALAASLGPRQREETLGDIERLLLWLVELRDAVGVNG